MSAGHFKLDNLVVLLDNNNLQIDGQVDHIMSIYPVKEKMEAFGWRVEEIDGHCVEALIEALDRARENQGQPCLLYTSILRQINIIHADHRDIPGNMKLGLMKGFDGADGSQVIGAEDSREIAVLFQKHLYPLMSALCGLQDIGGIADGKREIMICLLYTSVHGTHAVLGISGGLDSTLALLVTARAFDLLGLPRDQITAVTMPGFGTTDRTYQNACEMTRQLGATLKEVDIREAVTIHFRDIGHDSEVHDVTYENAQARERTQVLLSLIHI